MGIVIGPVLKRSDGYGFDVWTVAKGVARGYAMAEVRVSAGGEVC
jgi:hypothetical protein